MFQTFILQKLSYTDGSICTSIEAASIEVPVLKPINLSQDVYLPLVGTYLWLNTSPSFENWSKGCRSLERNCNRSLHLVQLLLLLLHTFLQLLKFITIDAGIHFVSQNGPRLKFNSEIRYLWSIKRERDHQSIVPKNGPSPAYFCLFLIFSNTTISVNKCGKFPILYLHSSSAFWITQLRTKIVIF